jgi:hypothetical protein
LVDSQDGQKIFWGKEYQYRIVCEVKNIIAEPSDTFMIRIIEGRELDEC